VTSIAGLLQGNLLLFVIRRFLSSIPLVLAIIVSAFLLIHLSPGDPISVIVGDSTPTAEQLDALYERYGLNDPLAVQLWNYMIAVLQGDLGYSYVNETPVFDLIMSRVPATLTLMLPSLVLFTIMGVLIGVFVSLRPYSLADNSASFLAVLGYSIPVFWLGQLLLLVFALWLGWLPSQGMRNLRAGAEGFGIILDVAVHLVLPAVVLGTRYLAINARLARAGMIESLHQDYVTAAKARGLPPRVVQNHALRNALIPVVTMLGVNFADVLTGAVLVEIVFGWPGLGRLLYDAIFARDYPVLMGMFIVASVSAVVANVLTDIAYSIVDPRVRQG
jgi:peptide/nickel transport system permease protein